MEKDNQMKSYYAVIPANVRYDKNLIPSAKLLYGEITALCNEKGYCVIDINVLSKNFSTSKSSVKIWLGNLINNKYIEVTEEKDIVKHLKGKSLDGLGWGSAKCNWCNINTSVLHEHHYPTPKAKGGKKIVKICPNCHHEFHFHSKVAKLMENSTNLKLILKLRGDASGKIV